MISLSLFSSLFVALNLLLFNSVSAGEPGISYPEKGNAVEGIVEILGTVPKDDFSSASISYSYMGDDDNWFLISRIARPVEESTLATWDTTTISDGVYQLKLSVIDLGGNVKEYVVTDISLVNYSRAGAQSAVDETGDKLTIPESTDGVSSTDPTPLPANPAAISEEDIRRTILTGGIIGAGSVLMFFVISSIKHFLNHK